MAHLDSPPLARLVSDMIVAAQLAECGATKAIRKSAAQLRDKAFAQYVWGE